MPIGINPLGNDDDDDSGGNKGFLEGLASGAGSVTQGSIDVATDVTGVSAWQDSQTAANLREDVSGADGPLDSFVARTNAGSKALGDLTLDNPNASLQEGVQAGMVGAYELGSGEDASDDEVAQAFSDAYTGFGQGIDNTVEGTAFDNPVTDAVGFGTQALVADPAEAVFGGVTGVDLQEGDAEATVGAADLFDIGVGAATAGGGTALAKGGTKALRDGPSALKRVFGGADEAASGADDAALAADEGATPALPAPGQTVDSSAARGLQEGTEESGGVFSRLRTGGAAGEGAEESSGFFSRFSRGSDDTAEEVAEEGAEESGGFFSRFSRGSDDTTEEVVEEGAEEGSRLRDPFLGSRSRQVATGATVGGGVLLGGAGVNALTGGGAASQPQGGGTAPDGSPWLAPTEATTTPAGCQILEQTSQAGESTRYFTLFSRSSGTVALDSDGSSVEVSESTPWGDLPAHSSEDAALAACQAYHDGQGATPRKTGLFGLRQPDQQDSGSDEQGTDADWSDPERMDILDPGSWALQVQRQTGGNRTRWFLTRGSETIEIINKGATVEQIGNQPLSEVPHFDSEAEARQAHEDWAKQAQDEDGSQGGEAGWSEWTRLREAGNWTIWSRAHEDGERVEILAASTTNDGTKVYLGKDGTVQAKPAIFESADAVSSALEKYAQRQQNGDVPEKRRPTGGSPGKGDIAKDASASQSGGGGLVETATSNPILAAVVVGGGGYAAYRYSEANQ